MLYFPNTGALTDSSLEPTAATQENKTLTILINRQTVIGRATMQQALREIIERKHI